MARKKNIQIPTARQLPSGNWFVQLRIDGKSISITEPTEREVIAKALAIKNGIIEFKKTPMADRPLTQAIDLWIADNEHRLSPSTIRGYVTCQKNGFKTLMSMRCGTITDKVVASAINKECKNYSPKTVVNRWRFIAQVLEWAVDKRFEPALPQVVVEPSEFLDQEELGIFLKHIKGKKVEITALLALSSLRRSEIAALVWDEGDIDLKNRWIHVRGAMVPDRDHVMITKETNKNSASRRDVPIIEPLYEALTAVKEKQGRVVPQHPATMLSRIQKACRDAGVPEVGCHGLRHSFASLCHILNVPTQVAMEIGGWSDRATMDRIYTHVSKRTKESYSNAFTAYFKPESDKNANESANKE
jgi:integrase